MTRVAYIVSAYKLPAQLARLLARLEGRGTTFVAHVDRRTSRSVFEEMVERTRRLDVTFLPRHRSPWGSFGHVQTTLEGISYLLESEIAFDYAVLLTGQDYPLRSPRAIERFLAEAEGRSFMSSWPLPHPPWGRHGGLDRLTRWHRVLGPRRARVSLPARRRLPAGLAPYGGSPYWCFSRAAVEYVQRFVTEKPELVRFFRHVYIPDELMFQTILMNSALRDAIVNDNVRYVEWGREPAPAILTRADLPAMLQSGALFARKFDETVDPVVLDELDAHIDAEPAE